MALLRKLIAILAVSVSPAVSTVSHSSGGLELPHLATPAKFNFSGNMPQPEFDGSNTDGVSIDAVDLAEKPLWLRVA